MRYSSPSKNTQGHVITFCAISVSSVAMATTLGCHTILLRTNEAIAETTIGHKTLSLRKTRKRYGNMPSFTILQNAYQVNKSYIHNEAKENEKWCLFLVKPIYRSSAHSYQTTLLVCHHGKCCRSEISVRTFSFRIWASSYAIYQYICRCSNAKWCGISNVPLG